MAPYSSRRPSGVPPSGIRQKEVVIEEFDHEGQKHLLIGYPAPRLSCLLDLTSSELEVTRAWMTGDSIRTIAQQRGVSQKTVSNQIASTYQKLGVSTRAELLTLVLEGRRPVK